MKYVDNQQNINERKVKMDKINCWEYKKCRREPGGIKVHELGVCPATVEKRLDGTHGGKVQVSFDQKYGNCIICDFYRLVKENEGSNYILSSRVLKILSKENKCLTGKK